MALEPIKRLVFSEPDKMRVQGDAIASAETWTERHIGRYRALDGAFGGRYIAADLFKETFAEYAASRESRARYNVAVHNASAVLSAELFRRVLEEPGAQGRALFLTGIPGAGKTTSVLVRGGLPADVKLIFEGQMWRPESTFPKLQQALDAGRQPVIAVVHPAPEYALHNTFKRFREIGRGASIETMADIQGGLPDGLSAVRERFGEAVGLVVYDFRDPLRRVQLSGWDNLPVLRSEGSREQIRDRLLAELERARRQGIVSPDAIRQAVGDARDARAVGRQPDARDGRTEPGRDAAARDRAQAFLTLKPEEGVRLFPELAGAYATVRMAELLAMEKMSRIADQEAFVERMRQQLSERIALGERVADPRRVKGEPGRER
jgi:hypothetical protein